MDIKNPNQVTQVRPEEVQAKPISIPLYLSASVLSSFFVVCGIIWDISWHTSIGRDGLFSAPHLLVYAGAVVAGVTSGFQVLRTSFVAPQSERDGMVKFWGIFYGSLGALFCIWGAIAMLTSAPFDDWWHNTYGLDVTILSPPHSVLAIGIMMIQFGAIISALSLQNKLKPTDDPRIAKTLRLMYLVATSLLLIMVFTLFSEFFQKYGMHGSRFYQVAGIIFPLFFATTLSSSKLKWAATITAFSYMFVMAFMVWILPLFPAEPLLGPILNHIENFQAFEFPLLLVFPAIALDLIKQRFGQTSQNSWVTAAMYGVAFTLVLLAVQWPFGDFLNTEMARGWFFGQESWYFGSNPDWEYRYKFMPRMVDSGFVLVKGIAIACLIATLSARLGMKWGQWMKQVQR